MITLGVDLGAEKSSIAFTSDNNQTELVVDVRNGESSTMSVFEVCGTEIYLGSRVEERILGALATQPMSLPKYQLGTNQIVLTDSIGREWYSEGIFALFLKKLIADLRSHHTSSPECVAIAVPSYFTDIQREGIFNAAKLAELVEVQLVDESLAAAIGLGDRLVDGMTLLVDPGAEHCSVSVIDKRLDRLETLASTSLIRPIGNELIKVLADDVIDAYAVQYQKSLNETDIACLRTEVRRFAFSELNQSGEHVFSFSDHALRYTIDDQQLDVFVRTLQEDILDACERCLQDAGAAWSDLRQMVVCGGAARNLNLISKLRENNEFAACIDVSGEGLLAKGAADFARMDNSRKTDFNPLSDYGLGIRVFDSITRKPTIKRIIPAGQALPVEYETVLYTRRMDQEQIEIELVQFQDTFAGEKISPVGTVTFGPIDSPKVNYPIKITISVLQDATVDVIAQDGILGDAIARSFSLLERDRLKSNLEQMFPWVRDSVLLT